jgi:hypothetical protein
MSMAFMTVVGMTMMDMAFVWLVFGSVADIDSRKL